MASRWRPALFLALIAVLVLPATSEAHTLKVSRAAKADRSFAKILCAALNEEEPGSCVAYRPGPCRQLGQHRVRCEFFLTLDFEDGSRGRCLNLVDWSIRGRSGRLHPRYLGIRSCVVLRPPETEEPPS